MAPKRAQPKRKAKDAATAATAATAVKPSKRAKSSKSSSSTVPTATTAATTAPVVSVPAKKQSESVNFNVILTFGGREQNIFSAAVPRATANDEAKFVTALLDSEDDLEAVEDLDKISVCQYMETEADSVPWLVATDGKFFFNTRWSNDGVTRRWSAFRDLYVKTRRERNKPKPTSKPQSNRTDASTASTAATATSAVTPATTTSA